MTDYWDTPAVDQRDEWRAAADVEPAPMTAYDCEANPLLATALGPDPWLPFTCPRCGSEDADGMPETCTCCGFRNYGEDQ